MRFNSKERIAIIHDAQLFFRSQTYDSLVSHESTSDQDVGGGRGVCCQGLSEVEVHSMEDILEVVRRAQVPCRGSVDPWSGTDMG